MKKGLLALLALMSLAVVAPAQTPAKPPMKAPPQKTTPMRDPKTGRFMKKAAPMKTAPKKTMPMRDPKTGRFMKKGTPPAKTTPPMKKGG